MNQVQESRRRKYLLWHISQGKDSCYWGLLKYYKTQEKERVRQMILEAANVYWSPFASRYFSKFSNLNEEQQEVWRCIYQLQQQVLELQKQFHLEDLNEGVSKPIDYVASEPIEFELCCRVEADSTSGKMVQYLMDSEQEFPLEKKLLWSNDAYWSAIAYRELGVLSDSQLIQCAINCVIRLSQHIEFLGNHFRLVPTFSYPRSLSEYEHQEKKFSAPEEKSLDFGSLPPEEVGDSSDQEVFDLNAMSVSQREAEEALLMDNPLYDEWGEFAFGD